MSSAPNRPWPLELRLAPDRRTLTAVFEDSRTFALSAEYLRVMTGSAEERGHGAGPRPPIAGKRGAAIRAIEPVGAYAVRLIFDDGHDTGLYTWDWLYALGAEQDRRWADYLGDLEAAGLSR